MKYCRHALLSLLSVVLLLCLLRTSVAEIRHEPSKDEQKLSVKIVTPAELNELLKANPNAVQMNATRTNIEGRSLHPRGRSLITYTLGTGRQTGDKLVASDSSTNDYDNLTSLKVTMKYPSGGGTGATITYVEINTYQSNSNGKAYVTSGGIGQTSIVVVVEAYKTYYFDFYSYVYGK